MRAIVLVGGQGTRLRPLTTTVPKPLLPIAGQPFLERQLEWLASHGVDEVVLSMGYLPDAFRARFPDDTHAGVRLSYVVEPYPLGTAGAIRFAAAAAGDDERFVVCNGDVLTTLDLGGLIAFHIAREAEATIHLTRVADPSAFGVVPTSADGEVRAFVEKPPPGTAPSSWINAGTYVLEASVLDRIPADLTVSIERETFPRMLEQHGRLFATGTDDYWLDIGTPDKYLEANRDVVAGKLGTPPVAGAVARHDAVWDLGAEIDDACSVEGPTLLGSRAVLETDSRVERAVVGADVVIGHGALVEDAVVLDGAWIGPHARVAGSIVGPRATIGPRAVLSGGSVVGEGAHVDASAALVGARVEVSAAAAG